MCKLCEIPCTLCEKPSEGMLIDPSTGHMEPSCAEHVGAVLKRMQYQRVAHLN